MRCETNGKYFLTFTPQESANLILLAWETLLDFYRAQESANRFMCTPGFSVCMYNTANRLVSRLSDRLLNNLSLFCKSFGILSKSNQRLMTTLSNQCKGNSHWQNRFSNPPSCVTSSSSSSRG